jgi:hypothetical protein
VDEFIRHFVSSVTGGSAKAVDRAVKERKATPPEIIQSRIVGPFTDTMAALFCVGERSTVEAISAG